MIENKVHFLKAQLVYCAPPKKSKIPIRQYVLEFDCKYCVHTPHFGGSP